MVHEKISKNSQKIALIKHFEATLEIIPVFLLFYHDKLINRTFYHVLKFKCLRRFHHFLLQHDTLLI